MSVGALNIAPSVLPEVPKLFELEELAAQELLDAVELSAIEPLLRNGQVRSLVVGETLIEAESVNKHLYLVLSGELSVRLSARESEPLTKVGPGQSVGEFSLIDNKPASAFVIAEVPTRVLALDEELLWILVNSSHGFSSNLLFLLVTRLRNGNALFVRQRDELEQLKFISTVDPLTGLFNRRWLESMMPRQLERSQRCDESLSLIMIDVDHFKGYNDEHGHLAGDEVLRTLGRTIRENLRPGDMTVRYGGEEFLAILPNCDCQGAAIVGERLRLAVSHTSMQPDKERVLPPVTISLGISELQDKQSIEDLIAASDAALYRAKGAGRNRVAF